MDSLHVRVDLTLLNGRVITIVTFELFQLEMDGLDVVLQTTG